MQLTTPVVTVLVTALVEVLPIVIVAVAPPTFTVDVIVGVTVTPTEAELIFCFISLQLFEVLITQILSAYAVNGLIPSTLEQ